MHRISKKLIKTLNDEINNHFEVSLSPPKIAVCGPQKFFNLYKGYKRKRGIKELIRLSNEVDLFYCDRLQKIVIPGFRRTGKYEFTILEKLNASYASLFHEATHDCQFRSGGYGKHNVFVEGCCEISTFVITGTIDIWSCYFEYVYFIWHLLDAITANPKQKYELIRKYNCATNPTDIGNEWLESFVQKNPRLKDDFKKYFNALESNKRYNTTKSLDKKIAWRTTADVVNELYGVCDEFA